MLRVTITSVIGPSGQMDIDDMEFDDKAQINIFGSKSPANLEHCLESHRHDQKGQTRTPNAIFNHVSLADVLSMKRRRSA